MRIWQIAAGEPHRYFDEVFLKYGVMIIGPSHNGNAKLSSYAKGKGPNVMNQVNAFANKPTPGDRIIIRKGNAAVGIGQIPQEASYSFEDSFGCILGWDLCHTWRVSWLKDKKIVEAIPNPFKRIKRLPTFTEIHNPATIAYVKAIDSKEFELKLPEIPGKHVQHMSYDDLRIKFFRLGVSHDTTENIISVLRQCNQLSDWYNLEGKENSRPTEYEVVSHMVLPLLLALGWSHQQIAVEWKRVDVALFLKTPTNAANCVGIIEAKGIGQSLGDVFSQPENYFKKLKLVGARKLIVTDGANIFIYNRKSDGTFQDKPDGYLNLRFLSESYLVPEGTSAVEALVQLLPSRF
jgi:hypothetical protein